MCRLVIGQWYVLYSCLKGLKLGRDFRFSITKSPTPSEIETLGSRAASRFEDGDDDNDDIYSSYSFPKADAVNNILQKDFLKISGKMHLFETGHKFFNDTIEQESIKRQKYMKPKKSVVTFGRSIILDSTNPQAGPYNHRFMCTQRNQLVGQLSQPRTTSSTSCSPKYVNKKSASPLFFRELSGEYTTYRKQISDIDHLIQKRSLRQRNYRAISANTTNSSLNSSRLSRNRKQMISPTLSIKSAPTPYRVPTSGRSDSYNQSYSPTFPNSTSVHKHQYSRIENASLQVNNYLDVCSLRLCIITVSVLT